MIEFLRFPVKLTFALVLALMVGFHFNLETPRWAVMTAGIVAGGTAFAAGGGPLFRGAALSRRFAYYRDIYWLYRRADHHDRHRACTGRDAAAVLHLGRTLRLALFADPR
ncbi:p-hydroxybenzoic acid efflux pump subunit AaeB [Pantoea agglomerans]|uniref:p-hydroxybenzoic acid efflux pump subunit AaeB n=1 Tax=Enterobacter agglomerans TaxID=549 RepID=A0A379AB49_ENTAG|nr:p-hydroxybenzoic acid efflux pump subunit AaeB [Pantoea agglomerans]